LAVPRGRVGPLRGREGDNRSAGRFPACRRATDPAREWQRPAARPLAGLDLLPFPLLRALPR
jgi:hypothetical protein